MTVTASRVGISYPIYRKGITTYIPDIQYVELYVVSEPKREGSTGTL